MRCAGVMHQSLHASLAEDGILSRRRHPWLIGRIDAAVRRGELVTLLPGTYAPASSFATLVLSVCDWDPDAVLTGSCAARLTWWRELRDETVRAATRRRPHRSVPGTALAQQVVAPQLVSVHRGLRLQHPAASALDLARQVGPSAIDEALRRRAATLGSLRWALDLMSWRPGNDALAGYLHASRDEPWSALERQAHELLRVARITGWKANYLIRVGAGVYYVDIAFPGLRLAVELDGWQFHSDRASFSADRQRDVALRLAGWTVLRFTSETISSMVPAVRRLRTD